jgi:hypothetical protein
MSIGVALLAVCTAMCLPLANAYALGSIKVTKVVVPSSDSGRFDLKVDADVVVDEGSDGSTATKSGLAPGTHTVSEVIGSTSPSALSEYGTSIACNDGGPTLGTTVRAVTITADETIECTITNTHNTETNIQIQDFKVLRSTSQAGAHPRVDIRMRFCNDGVQIADVTGAGVPIRIRTATPHGVPEGARLRIIYVTGNTAANGVLFRAHVLSETELELRTNAGVPVIGSGDYTGGGELYSDQNTVASRDQYGCTAQAGTAYLRDFTLKLPPGFIGNPTSVPACPTFIWLAGSCPQNTQLGHAFAEAISGGVVIEVPTSVFNLQTMGLEPARLGTEVVPAFPPGPLPNTVTIRTTGDYGIDSSQINIPKELGASAGTVRNINVVLCERVPCNEAERSTPQSVAPIEPARPFFVNPTSCGTKTVRLEARSWNPPDPGDARETDLVTTGCDQTKPPFDATVSVAPKDKSPGASDQQTVSIDYPRGPLRSDAGGRVWGCPTDLTEEPGCTYDFDEIWQASLKDADVTLPPGMGLAPGGGNGLEVCTFTQFGVDPSTGKQLNDDAVRCPEGSHVGDIEVVSPALPTTTNADGEPVSITGKAFFGPTGNPGRPTAADPWKLFLLLEGHGLRIKLVGDVSLSESGQVRTVFASQPEVPFGHFRLKMGDAKRAVLLTPIACGPASGNADLLGYNGKTKTSSPTVEPANCNPDTPFNISIDEASAQPEQAGSHSVSHIVISRPDGNDMLKGLKLSLPPGAAGSLTAVAKCPLAQAQAGACPDSTLVGNIKTTLGSGISLFTVPGKLFLAEAAAPGDVASIVATVPAKAGVPDPQTGKYPIDLGPDVVIINRLRLREEDTGVDTILQGAYRNGQLISDGGPSMLEGVPLPIHKIEITVDRAGFFLNPTGCDVRNVVGTFTSVGGKTSVSSFPTQAKGCDKLPFDPTLYMIVGERGKTKAGQNVHPPLTAIVTQKAGEAAISKARVLVPDVVRPNVPFLNEPGALCSDAQAQARTCPPKSLVGSARVITPVLPFELRGPVNIVQEIGSILPKLYVYLRGGGFEVLLKARNRITGVRTENTFDFVPDVPQSYFELKINGGKNGLLNNFFDLCKTPADSKSRRVEATFNGHNGAVRNTKFAVRVEGCGSTLAAARLATTRIAVNRKGIAKVKVSCRRKDRQCRGSLKVKAKGLSAAKSFKIAKRKSRTLKLKFSKREVKRLRKAKRKQMKGKATTKVGSSSSRRAVTLVYKRR